MPLDFAEKEPLRGVWRIEESGDELLARLTYRDECPPVAAKPLNPERWRERLAVRVLLKELLGEETDVAYHADGAPYLPDKPWHIGISHTKGYAAVVVNKRTPVAIDIEYRSDRAWQVRRRFMSHDELAQLHPTHSAEHALVYWCAKEVLFKLLRQPVADLRRQLSISPFPYAHKGSLTATETFTLQSASYRLHYLSTPRFTLAWLP